MLLQHKLQLNFVCSADVLHTLLHGLQQLVQGRSLFRKACVASFIGNGLGCAQDGAVCISSTWISFQVMSLLLDKL